MEILIGIIFVILIFIVIVFRTNRNKKSEMLENELNLSINHNENSFPDIQIIENLALVPLEENKIVDLEIKNAISMIDNYASKSIIASHNIKNASELLKNDKAFFSAAKEGTENMLKVKGTNEHYGIQMAGNKFDKQTKFLSEEELMKFYGKDALVNAGFNVASMVVGQYYMSEINHKLDMLQDDIQEISDFLDSEYKGKLAQIISKMQEIIENKVEILKNSYSRDKRFDEILRAESECGKLLAQANTSISQSIMKEENEYREYEKKAKEINKWFIRQQILQQLLLEIGNLRYVLAYGNETSKLSHTQYNNYLKQTNRVNAELENWHNINCEKFGIEKEEQKRKAKFFEIRKNTIGRIKEEWAYHKLEDNVVDIINSQTNRKELTPYNEDKQNEKIKIQKYKGEYYNLPS